MASSKIKGITIEIGGDTTKLGKAIADSESKSRSLQGELKQVEKLLKFDPSNVDLIAQRQQILTEAVEETSKKLKTLKDAEEQVIDQFNKGDIGEDQLRAFQREIIKTEGELSGFQNKLDGTEEDIKDVGDSAEKSSDGFTIMGGALADLVSNAIQGAISAIGDFLGSLLELSEATEEYRSMQAKLEGSSKTFGYSVEFANEKYKEFYKYLGDDQMATNAITNLMGIGTSTDSVSKLAEGATAVWASYGDSIPIESLTESMNETIKVGKVTGTFADTINWCKESNEQLNKALGGNKDAQKAFNDALKEGLPAEDAFNEALAKITDEQERADVVAKYLNDTYGASKTTYDELNKSVTDANEAELALKDTQAQLGETVAPVNNAITEMKNKALEAIAPLVEKLADGFMDLYNWLQKNPAVMHAITAVVIALTGAFTVLAGALAIQGIIAGVTKAFAFLSTTMLANPITLIIAGIVALVSAFVYLWKNCESFRNFWKKVWDNIKSVYSKTVSAIKTGFNNIVSGAKELPSKIYSAIQGAISRVKNWGSSLISTAGSAIRNMVKKVVEIAKELPGKFVSVGKDIIGGIKKGISNAIGGLYDSIKKSLSGLVDKAKEALGINSPSKIFAEVVGKAIPEGVAKGVKDNIRLAGDAVQGMTDDLTDQAYEINGATINRKLSSTFTGGAVSNVVDNASLLGKLNDIYDRLGRIQMVTDTGALVGEMIDKIDASLADRQLLSARGV